MKQYVISTKQWVQSHTLASTFGCVGLVGAMLLAIASVRGNATSISDASYSGASFASLPQVRLSSSDIQQYVDAAVAQRQEALVQMIGQIDHDLRVISANIHVDWFACDMLTWNSKLQMVGGSEAHRQWARQRFQESVLDPADLRLVLQQRSQQLQTQLTAIDNELLINLQADVDTTRPSLSPQTIDLTPINQRIQTIVDHAEQAVWDSVAELVVTTGVSTVTGNVASSVIQDFGAHDELGNPTIGNQIGSFFGGLIVGLATDVAITEAVNIQGELETKVQSAVDDGLQQLYVGAAGSSSWMEPLQKLVDDHQAACAQAITTLR